MTVQSQFAVATALAVGTAIVLGFIGSRRHTLISFFWGQRDLPPGLTSSLIVSTSFSLNGVLYQTWLGYSIGLASIWLQVVWCISFLLLAAQSQRLALLSRQGTLHGVISNAFGSNAGHVAAVASIVGLVSLIGWELVIAASLFLATGISRSELLVVVSILALMSAAYTIRGGLMGNAKVNLAQNVIGAAGWIAAIVYVYSAISSSAPSPVTGLLSSHKLLATQLGFFGLATNIVFSLCWQFVDMSNWQNISATDGTSATTRKSLVWGAAAILFFPGIVGAIAGVALSRLPGLNADTLVPKMIEIACAQPLVGILLLFGFFSAMMSTLDGYFLSCSQAFTWDLIDKRRVLPWLTRLTGGEVPSESVPANDSSIPLHQGDIRNDDSLDADDAAVLTHAKLFIIAAALVGGVGFSMLFNANVNLFQLVYVAVVAQLPLFPSVMVVLFFPSHAKSFNGFVSIFAGLVCGTLFVAIGVSTGNNMFLDAAGTTSVLVAALAGVPWAKVVRQFRAA